MMAIDNYWADVNNRYKYLCQFAKRNGFEPLKPEGWYSLDFDNAMQDKVRTIA
jgi:hypothetical protein